MANVDLHTHSIASPDGSLAATHYQKMLHANLDYVAITDHNTIAFAQDLHKKLGDKIIVGEEITTTEGEIVGLFLTDTVAPGQSLADTVTAIKKQGGLVYVPHPFETVRKGVTLEALNTIAKAVDIIETHNGRAVFHNKSADAKTWAAQHEVVAAASSDAHGWHGWGKTYSILEAEPTRATLVKLLAKAKHQTGRPGIRGMLYPKLNRIRRKHNA